MLTHPHDKSHLHGRCHNVPSAARQPPGPISTRAIPQEQKRPSVSDSSAPQPLRDLVDTPTPQPMEKDKPASATSRNPSIGPLGNVSVSAGCGLSTYVVSQSVRTYSAHAQAWPSPLAPRYIVGRRGPTHERRVALTAAGTRTHAVGATALCLQGREPQACDDPPRARRVHTGNRTHGRSQRAGSPRTGHVSAYEYALARMHERKSSHRDQLGKHPPLRALPPFHGIGHNGRERRLGLMSSRL